MQQSDKPVYSISMAAKLMGISVHTLRKYELRGFILPFKTETNQRLYSDTEVERIKRIMKELSEGRLSIKSIQKMAALIPCWLQRECSDEDRRNCRSYEEYDKPCWMYKHEDNLCEKYNCRECEVYKFNTDPEKIRETIRIAFVDKNSRD
ncbi:MAG: MerR family transcriptional regulator [Bacteroidetes bacterium]|nr:MerR family transcriptional regulator [Bacteroidota bacterium]